MTFYLRFSLQLMFCESMFLLKSERRKYFWLRLIACLAVYFSSAYLFSEFHGSLDPYHGLVFLTMFLATLAIIMICFKIKIKDVVFAGTGGYALQHSTWCLMSVISYYTGFFKVDGFWGDFLDYNVFRILPFIIVGIASYFCLIKPCIKSGAFENKSWYIIILSVLILISAIVLNEMSGMRVNGSYSRFTTNVVCRLYSILCCITVLLLQCVLFRNERMKRNNELLSYMLELQKEQYCVSKETINLINLKCHDLKHQILALNEMTSEERARSIEELKNQVGIYDSIAKTGSSSLDIVLMEKSLLCDKRNITFSYIVDAEKLKIMQSVDIYTLFGNALDNAIESVCLEKDEEKRLISLNIHSEGEMLFIHLENYFNGELEFKDGLPQSKGDSRFHGFGTKSIEFIVKKYGGQMRMTAEDSSFCLDIVLPLTDKQN